ncbi:MAG: MBL fold metallo-hydrolase [Negativicutes bacterium]|nr:MBL fold metallo-hydrolase [Negativicutes bacterium]
MRLELVFQGFPGKLASGYMGWSTVMYLEAGGKKVLWDTGGPGKRNDIGNRLSALGVQPTDIEILIMSHFHEDHVYNFDLFPQAEMVLHRKEAEWVESGIYDWPQAIGLYSGVKNSGRLRLVSGDEEILPGVQTIHLPGHTPGCMGLVLRGDDMPTTVLAGDAVKNIAELATGKAAMSLDPQATMESIAKVRNIAKIVMPGHDRKLEIQSDRIVALSTIRETIVIPAGVVDRDKPHYFELVIEPTWLPIE